jgi:hypothetical protein
MRASGRTLFYRPAEKAGEVWALDADYAGASEALECSESHGA